MKWHPNSCKIRFISHAISIRCNKQCITAIVLFGSFYFFPPVGATIALSPQQQQQLQQSFPLRVHTIIVGCIVQHYRHVLPSIIALAASVYDPR